MKKAYYVEEYGYCDPKIVLLDMDNEQFTLALYEKLYSFMATGNSIDDEARIEVGGVNVLLSSVLKEEGGDYNYSIKDLNIVNIDTLMPIQVGQSNEKLFFMPYRSYLPDTEDDFIIKFVLISCEGEEDFKKEFESACKKSANKREYGIDFKGVYFSSDDVYHVDRNGKLDIFYPSLTEVV